MKYPLYHLAFPSQYLLTSTLMRIEEFFESPRFKGQVFTQEEYMDWYAASKGSMAYFSDWAGFNIPSVAIKQFETLFHHWLDKEKKLLNLLRREIREDEYYLIATHSGVDADLLLHAIMHGLYYLHPHYKAAVQATLANFDLTTERETLIDMGYHPSVLDDELNAYIMTGLRKGFRKKICKTVHKALAADFKQTFDLDIDNQHDQLVLRNRITWLVWPD